MGEIAHIFGQSVPDADLRLHLMGDRYDLTRYRQTFTNVNGVVLGHQMHFTAASSQHLRYPAVGWRSGDHVGTILAWIRLDSVGAWQVVFSSCDEASNARYFRFNVENTNQLSVLQANNDVYDHIRGGTVLTAGRWYRVALVSSGSAYAIYLDGQAETLTVVNGANGGDWLGDTDDRDNVIVGAQQRLDGALLFFDGNIRDLQYLSRELFAGEMLLDHEILKRFY